ncbi:Arc family DNA-binding protein [Stenotrophomonas maltophilia]|uniref:Arc family DNA-binding protein n=1 Tax=Stenotrophomonas maltophilia TaxID=40324 RepID=UPI0021C72A01|nr:Arc family DNA-binding protein [Stenotrophomonas maltophilia]MCU1139430.1 Arc family DNA-binding protein [Stenotrophomonas maltophilia]
MARKTETRPATGHINPFGLRMQPELKERLEEAASESGRSLNAEIVARLEESFVGDGRKVVFTPDTMSLLLRSRLESLKSMIATVHDDLAVEGFSPEATEAAQEELSYLEEFSDTIRQALFYAVKAKYSGEPIPAEVEQLASDLAQMPF